MQPWTTPNQLVILKIEAPPRFRYDLPELNHLQGQFSAKLDLIGHWNVSRGSSLILTYLINAKTG